MLKPPDDCFYFYLIRSDDNKLQSVESRTPVEGQCTYKNGFREVTIQRNKRKRQKCTMRKIIGGIGMRSQQVCGYICVDINECFKKCLTEELPRVSDVKETIRA